MDAQPAPEKQIPPGEQFPPYEGPEPYIFVGYSHQDSARILPILDTMMHDGYRVWYDEGIFNLDFVNSDRGDLGGFFGGVYSLVVVPPEMSRMAAPTFSAVSVPPLI